MNHPPYAIVINTSVARAAGTTENPTARKCRETLEAVDRCGHQLAMCRELYQEWMQQRPKEIAEPWQSYASRYPVEWFTRMQSQGKIRWVNLNPDNPLKDRVIGEAAQLWPHSRVPEEVSKDWHLVDLALHTDHRVVSLNDRERGRFSELARRVDELRTIFWLNPNRADVPDWLCRGAPEEEAYRLGAKSPSHAHSCPVD